MRINLPHNIQDGTRSFAAKVMANFKAIVDWTDAGAGAIDVNVEGLEAEDVNAALTELLVGVLDRYTKAESDANLAAHTERTDNPHEVTAGQTAYNSVLSGLDADNTQDALDSLIMELYSLVARDKGAIASLSGVDNAAGDVLLVPGTGIAITPDNDNKSIRITATGQSVPAPHAAEHEFGGSDALTSNIAYNNSASGLTANTVQEAMDELMGAIKRLQNSSRTSFERLVTGRWVL